jgi:hypothetical protein
MDPIKFTIGLIVAALVIYAGISIIVALASTL